MKQITKALLFCGFTLFLSTAVNAQALLEEDFTGTSGSTPPTGWTNNIISGTSGTDTWRFNNPGGRTISSPMSSPAAIFDSDWYSGGGGQEDVALESPSFSPATGSVVILEFDHDMDAAFGGVGIVEAYNGSSWSNVATFSTSNNGSKMYNISSNVAGVSNAKVRFRWTGDWSMYWMIDNIVIYSLLPRDMQLSAFIKPLSECGLSSSQTVEVRLLNKGQDTLFAGDTIPVAYTVNSGTIIRDTLFLTSKLNPGSTTNFTFSTGANLSSTGTHILQAWTHYRADGDASNDSLTYSVANIPYVSSFPYNENFENGAGGWTTAGPTAERWELGTPNQTNLNSAANGNNAWMTDLDANYQNNDQAFLLSPCYNFDNLRIPYLSFYLNFNSENNWDALVLEATTDGTNWSKVGENAPNFYNNNSNNGNLAAPKWAGNNNGWTEYTLSLTDFHGESYVRFRFHFNSDGSVSGYEGFGVDSFSVLDSCVIASASPAPNVSFVTPDTVYVNSPATFLNAYAASVNTSYVEHEWYVNGTFLASSEDFTYTFTSTGNNDVKLKTFSCWGVDSFIITVNVVNPTVAPLAGFIADQNSIEVFDEIQFTDLSSYGASSWEYIITPDSVYDPVVGFMVETYYWASGNQNSRNPVIGFYYPGKYSVCQVVTNSIGSDTLCITDYIEVTAPVTMCGFLSSTSESTGLIYDSGGPNSNYGNNQNCSFLIQPCADTVTLNFTAFELETGWDYLRIYDGTDNTGTPLWNVTADPDGMTGNMSHASFVNNLVAASGSMYFEFESDFTGVRPGFAAEWNSSGGNFVAPTARFISADTVCAGSPISFENTSVGDNLSYRWEVNNTVVSTSKNTSQTFTGTGNWTVKLTVENCGGISVFTKNIVVISPSRVPAADFVADILTPNVGETVTFTDVTEFCVDPNSYQWTITPATYSYVNGTDQNSRNPQVQFSVVDTYTVKLRVANSFGADSITKVDYIKVVDYCTPIVRNLSKDIGINRVIVGDIDNSSASGISGYTSYAQLTPANLEYQGDYIITVERNTNLNPINRKVWIDYNQDGDFDDAGELVASGNSSTTRSWSDTFTVPVSARSGATLMRVGVNYGSLANLPCGPNQYGEFEDYRVIISPDVTRPEITLIGNDTVRLAQCAGYTDAGATADDNVSGNLTNQIQVTGLPIDTCIVGTYLIRYDVADAEGNNAVTVVRVVIVETDTIAPVISLAGNNPDTIEVYTAYIEAGYTATDNIEGNMTSQVIVTGNVDTALLGTYTITYSVSDAQNNMATEKRVVVVVDRTAPIVSVAGSDTVYVEACTGYTEAGATVSDNYDTTVQVTVTGMVDTTRAGTYTLNYCATDASGNRACEARTVIVQDTRKPSVSLIGSDTITIDVLGQLNDPGINVSDNCNMNWTVTHSGTWTGTANTLGCFTKVYTVMDAAGNDSSVSRTICVVDRVAPTIALNGEPVVYLARWSTWNDPMVTASDNFDGSPNIVIGGNYTNTLLAGTFYRTYQVCDQSNNCSRTETRLIIIYEPSDSGVGIAPNALASAVNVYPNPTSGQFVVEVDLPEQEKVTISVLDMHGRQVMHLMENQVGNGKHKVDLTNAKSGVYFVRIQTADAVVMKKVTLAK